jgi:hypothetical protein
MRRSDTLRKFLAVCAVAVASFAASSLARTWHVSVDGSGDAPTIQAGIDSAATADTVLIAPGTYNENLNTHGKGLVLRGEAGPEATIVDGGQRARVLMFDTGGVLEHLTLRNGRDLDGGGLRVAGAGPAVIRGNIIENNESWGPGMGGGIYYVGFVTADVVIEANIIRGNLASGGGGLLVANNGTAKLFVRGNLIDSNIANERAGGIKTVGAYVTDNIISRNFASVTGGGLEGGQSGEISRNTIAYNQTANLSDNGAGITVSSGITVENNLVVGNHSDTFNPSGAGIYCFGAVPKCNLLWANDIDLNSCTSDPSNVSADPQFCATDPRESMNWFIQSDSPCAPAQSACGLIGARSVGCGTTDVHAKAWSDVKTLYR